MNAKNFLGQVITENLMRKFRLVLSYDDPYLIYLFVNILMGPHFFKNRDDDLTNIWLAFHFLTEFSRNWKKSFSETTLFLRSFHFCINFINLLTNNCVDQVVLELQAWKKFLISTTDTFPFRKSIPDRQNISNQQ